MEVEEKKFPYLRVKISLDGNSKKELNNVYVELRNKEHSETVYFKQLSSFTNGAYTFTDISVDQFTMVKGDYEVTLVVVDDLLAKES